MSNGGKQSLRASYIPVVQYREHGGKQSEALPDWLNAAYVDLQERRIQYTLYTVTDSDLGLPDGISYKMYQSEDWWWLICNYNGIVNPYVDLQVGQRLRIPNLQQAQLYLQQQQAGSKQSQVGQFVSL